jgi:hypothetical protein
VTVAVGFHPVKFWARHLKIYQYGKEFLMKKTSTGILVTLTSLLFVMSTASPASAFIAVSGTVPRDGSMVAYETYRTYNGQNGVILMDLHRKSDIPTLRLGLRDTKNVQFTTTVVFDEPTPAAEAGKPLSRSVLYGTRFALNARSGYTIGPDRGNYWAGDMKYI